jgi:hypothetical protein
MSDGTCGIRRPQRATASRARLAAVILFFVSAALVVVACSSGSPPSAGSSDSPSSSASGSAQLVAFSQCMRSDGVPSYPDPSVAGGVATLPKESAQLLGVSSAQYSAAERSCQHLLPTGGGVLTASSLRQCYLALVCPQALVQHAVTAGRQFAGCMRSHGVPNWPDPTIDPEGRPVFNITVPRPPPHQTAAAINECTRLEHAGSLLAWG